MSNNKENNEKIEITFDDNLDIVYEYVDVKYNNKSNFKKCNFLLRLYVLIIIFLILIFIILFLVLYLI